MSNENILTMREIDSNARQVSRTPTTHKHFPGWATALIVIGGLSAVIAISGASTKWFGLANSGDDHDDDETAGTQTGDHDDDDDDDDETTGTQTGKAQHQWRARMKSGQCDAPGSCGKTYQGEPVCYDEVDDVEVDTELCKGLPALTPEELKVKCPDCAPWQVEKGKCLDVNTQKEVTCGRGQRSLTYTCTPEGSCGELDPVLPTSEECLVQTTCEWRAGNWKAVGSTETGNTPPPAGQVCSAEELSKLKPERELHCGAGAFVCTEPSNSKDCFGPENEQAAITACPGGYCVKTPA